MDKRWPRASNDAARVKHLCEGNAQAFRPPAFSWRERPHTPRPPAAYAAASPPAHTPRPPPSPPPPPPATPHPHIHARLRHHPSRAPPAGAIHPTIHHLPRPH